MSDQLELATAMLAITLSAVLLVTGSFHLERLGTDEARARARLWPDKRVRERDLIFGRLANGIRT